MTNFTRRAFIALTASIPFASRLTAGTPKAIREPYIETGQVVSMINWEYYPVRERFIGASLVHKILRWDEGRQCYPVMLRNNGYDYSKPFVGVDGRFTGNEDTALLFRDQDLADYRAEGIYDSKLSAQDFGHKNWAGVISERRGLT